MTASAQRTGHPGCNLFRVLIVPVESETVRLKRAAAGTLHPNWSVFPIYAPGCPSEVDELADS